MRTGKKPEEMTLLRKGRMVEKTHPNIVFRGKLDSLLALLLLTQAECLEHEGAGSLYQELVELQDVVQEIFSCDALGTALMIKEMLGWDQEEIRERSHHAEQYYQVNTFRPVHGRQRRLYYFLNLLRTQARECEIAAVGGISNNPEIIRVLNRMSSIFHIMMCRCQAGEYSKEEEKHNENGTDC